MSDSYNDDTCFFKYFRSCAIFLIVYYYIILVGGNISSLTLKDIIIYFIFPLSVVLISWVLYKITKRNEIKLRKRNEKKELKIKELKEHKKELIDDVLKKLELMEIKCEEFIPFKEDDDFRVWITGLDELKEKNTYKQTIQHLKIAYPDIYRLWDGSIKKIYGDNGLNDELKGLRTYLSGKISDEFEGERVKLHSNIWSIMEWAKSSEKIKDSEDLNKFLDGINIDVEKNNVYITSDLIKNPPIQITFRKLDATKVSNFLSDLIKKDKDNDFRKKVKSFIIGYTELKKTFDDNFKTKLEELLQEVDGDEDKLKGECNECSSCVKEIAKYKEE